MLEQHSAVQSYSLDTIFRHKTSPGIRRHMTPKVGPLSNHVPKDVAEKYEKALRTEKKRWLSMAWWLESRTVRA